jgi:hypothetical protein
VISYLRLFFELTFSGYPFAFWTGFPEKRRNRTIQKEFGFHAWHIIPVQHRLYALKIADYISARAMKETVIVEVGCGLGAILGRIRYGMKYGYDHEHKVIEAARMLYETRKDVLFSTGSFEQVKMHKRIDFLVMVNFIHEIEPQVLKGYLLDILSTADVGMIVADEVQGPGYKYHHSFAGLLPADWRLADRKRMNGMRDLVVFTRQMNVNHG